MAEEEPIIVDLSGIKKTNTPLKLSDFAESISYIQLDENPLLGDMAMATVHVVNDTIYIDRENIYKYTSEGEFIGRVFIEGLGPGEARKFVHYHAALNRDKRYFTFMNGGKFTFVSFSFEGEYLGEEAVIDSLERRIYTYFNNSLLFEYPMNGLYEIGDKVNMLGPYLLYAKDADTGEIVYKYPNPAADELAVKGKSTLERPQGDMLFVNSGEQLWFKHKNIDTIYQTIDLEKIVPKYIIKPHKSFMNIHRYTHYKVMDMTKSEAMSTDAISGFIPLLSGGFVYGLNYGIGVVNPSGKASDWYDKAIVNDLDDYLDSIDLLNKFYHGAFTVNNGSLYFTIDAYLFFEEGSCPPFPSLTEDSNPVVVKIKLK